ncbi:MAG TPA: homogentisate 1,2-dioxygenase, partial [Bdellovibrio sp.]|nr:homogentisate 1,2-dioxygenase [Bdellovibrio sp.]
METQYLSGFGNHFSSEARPNTLPQEQNSPQVAPKGLYPEQLSGTAFTAPRAHNLYAWLYRLRPSVMHKAFHPLKELTDKTFFKPKAVNPNQMRWNPLPAVNAKQNFIEGIRTVCGTGNSHEQRGIHIHLYSFSEPMGKKYFMSADGDFLFVPQTGTMEVKTELGILTAEPGEILVVPRGMKFQVNPLQGSTCSGYIGENFGAPYQLPELGPIGANGLAHRRHFQVPVAAF